MTNLKFKVQKTYKANMLKREEYRKGLNKIFMGQKSTRDNLKESSKIDKILKTQI